MNRDMTRRGKGVDPRVCGVAEKTGKAQVNKGGRSPRVRGSRYAFESFTEKDGSIPACAG